MNDLSEKTADSTEIYRGCLLHIFRDEVILPDGSTSVREYNRHTGAVCVIPVDENMNVILEHQYRYPVGETITEIPAGKLNSADEDPEQAGRRELLEETGITAEKFIPLGYFYPACAYSDEKIMMFLAEGLTFGEMQPDEGEFLEIFRMPLDDLLAEIDMGGITDIKTQAAAMRAERYYRNKAVNGK